MKGGIISPEGPGRLLDFLFEDPPGLIGALDGQSSVVVFCKSEVFNKHYRIEIDSFIIMLNKIFSYTLIYK